RERRRDRARPPGRGERRAAPAHDPDGDEAPAPEARARLAVRGRRAGGGLRAGARLMGVFRVEMQPDGIAHLVMDHPARKVNVLDAEALGDLGPALDQLESAPSLPGVVVMSGKPGSFIAGADVAAIGSLTDRDDV